MVVVPVIVAWWFYCGKQAQIAIGAWQALSSFISPFLPSSHFAASLPTLFISPPLLNGFIVPCHFQRKRIEIIWNRHGMVTYDALLSVNYLLIILFILAATTAPLSIERGQQNFILKIARQWPRQKMNMHRPAGCL